jgi:hypothetical protein
MILAVCDSTPACTMYQPIPSLALTNSPRTMPMMQSVVETFAPTNS